MMGSDGCDLRGMSAQPATYDRRMAYEVLGETVFRKLVGTAEWREQAMGSTFRSEVDVWRR